MSINTDMAVRVTAITQVAESVKRFRFERVDGKPFPVFPGGAHVVVAWKDGGMIRRNPYSLMSAPGDTSAYEISVLRVEKSRGGSAFLHEKVKVGDTLSLSQPVDLFPIDQRGMDSQAGAAGPAVGRAAQRAAERALWPHGLYPLPDTDAVSGRHWHHALHGDDGSIVEAQPEF